MFKLDTILKKELRTLKSMIKINLDVNNGKATANLSNYNPYNYLEQNPEIAYILGVQIKSNRAFNKFNHREFSLTGLLEQTNSVLADYDEIVE